MIIKSKSSLNLSTGGSEQSWLETGSLSYFCYYLLLFCVWLSSETSVSMTGLHKFSVFIGFSGEASEKNLH